MAFRGNRTDNVQTLQGTRIRRIKYLHIYDDLKVIEIVEHIHWKFNKGYALLRIYDDLKVIYIVEHIYRKFMHVKHMPSICRTTHLGLSRLWKYTTHLGLSRLWKYGNCINCLWQSLFYIYLSYKVTRSIRRSPGLTSKCLVL